MSYGSSLNTLMTGDASLNALCTGGIFYENLPDNFDMTDTWIVYSYRRSEQRNCLNTKNAFTTYSVTAKIVTYDSEIMETVSDTLVSVLNGASEGGIRDIWLVADNHAVDLEKGIYMNSLEFESFYTT
jgi:hypothetical protein